MNQQSAVICVEVDREDLEVLYLAGRLDSGRASAFEEHCFRCDRCWELLVRASEIRAVELARRRLELVRNSRPSVAPGEAGE